MMVGSYYYLATRGDWVYTSLYHSLREQAREKTLKDAAFDEDRLEAMETYIDNLEANLAIIYGDEVIGV